MPGARFFGYGSLVNLRTHTYRDPQPHSLDGWRRIWQGTTLRAPAYLSIHPAPGQIRGLCATASDWAALDVREAAYDRHQSEGISHYRLQPALLRDGPAPILLSYLDAVLQGFDAVYGPSGVTHFLGTTDGWHHPVWDDRAAPVYPRAQRLPPPLTARIDAALRGIGAQVVLAPKSAV